MKVWSVHTMAGLCGGLILSVAVGLGPAYAGGFLFGDNGDRLSRHKKSDYYSGKPQVRSYRRRVGGYSYARQDKFFFDAFPRIKYGVEPNYATLPSTH